MDHSSSISSRFRNKFWFVFFALFVFWYLILYGFDWSSISGLTSSLPSSLNHALQEKPHIQSVIPAQEEVYSNNVDPEEQERVANATIFSIEETSGNFSGNNETDKEETEGDTDEVGDLEKELEPLFKDDDSGDDENEGEKSSCSGRYIYVHDLPSRFNQDLLKQCRLLNQWADMCQYLLNNGLGTDFGSSRIFSRTSWFNTNQFSLEVIFHNKMKQYDCLTNDSSKAAAVFVPYYAGLDVSRYLWDGHNTTMRDADFLDLAKWLRGKPEWKRMWGRDHFMVAGRITWDFRRGVDEDYAWGNKLMLLPEMKNMTILTIESSPWNRNDFAIPYPTYFHPWNDNDVLQWQNRMKKQRRRSLFCFAGGPRPDLPDSIRGQILEQCKSSKRKCALIECTNNKNKCQKPEQVMKMFQNSIFCLQPPGDSFTRRSTFDSILAGCIPVFFTPASAYVQYIWHLPKDYKKYSVLIPEGDVKNKAVNIENVLSRIPKSRVNAMREEVIRMIPNVVYADPRSRLKKYEDAFDLTVKGVIERLQSLRKQKNPRFSFNEEVSWKYYTFGMVGKHEWDHYFRRTDKAKY